MSGGASYGRGKSGFWTPRHDIIAQNFGQLLSASIRYAIVWLSKKSLRRKEMIVGSGDFKYELIEGWGKLPEYFEMDDPVDIAVSSQDRVYVTSRGNHPVLIFGRKSVV